jgi:hypothetical protein
LQEQNRFRFWGAVEKLEGKFLRVITLEDKTTIRIVFPDRRFNPYQVVGLKTLEKIHLVKLILESLDKPDHVIQEKWIEGSERRFDDYKDGKIKALSYLLRGFKQD